jgi:hypothetical protein
VNVICVSQDCIHVLFLKKKKCQSERNEWQTVWPQRMSFSWK